MSLRNWPLHPAMRPRIHTAWLTLAILQCLAMLPMEATVFAAPTRIDMVEHIFGATAIHAVSGHGRLSIGVAADGDLTTLVWPNPSYSDQLAFISSNALDARDKPRFGAPAGSGLYLGLDIQLMKSPKTIVWLHDASQFTVSQDYGSADGSAIHTRYTGKLLPISVEVTDAVLPQGVADADVLVRQVQVQVTGTDTQVLGLRTYANLSPQPPNSRLPELPLVDWGLDGRNDFAALWDAKAGAIVHFHPHDQLIFDMLLKVLGPTVNYGAIGTALAAATVTPSQIQDLADQLDTLYTSGAYVALTTLPAPSSHQIGYDRTDFCAVIGQLLDNAVALPKVFAGFTLPMDPSVLDQLRCPTDHQWPDVAQGWQHPALAAAIAVTSTDALPSNDLAAGEVDEALLTPLNVTLGQQGQATVVLTIGATAASAKAALATVKDGQSVVDAAESALAAWAKGIRFAKNSSAAVVAVARRSLINVRVGTRADNGSVVASIARQPPYGLDWPRDGAFFELAFDVSGQTDLALKRADFSAGLQRQAPVSPSLFVDTPPPVDPRTGKSDQYPAGAWEMNYYSDGVVGGNVRFEIDNTAFALWSLCAHTAWTADPAERIAAHWPAMQIATNLLADWRDASTGLQALASEDDNAAPSQTLHGAVTVSGALELASKCADKAGHSTEAKAWHARAQEINAAIITQLFDSKTGLFAQAPNTASNPGSQSSGPTAWLVWPMRILPWNDKRVEAQLTADYQSILPTISLSDDQGGAYFLKNLLSLAIARGQDKTWRPKIQAALEQVAALSTDGTHHFGEVTVPVTQGGDCKTNCRHADQRVATPHLWEGTLFYLTTLALEDPAALQKESPATVAVATPAAAAQGGCEAARSGAVPDLSLVFLVAVLGLLARRKNGIII